MSFDEKKRQFLMFLTPSASTRRPSASVLFTSTVLPENIVMMSSGRRASLLTAFSARQKSACKLCLNPCNYTQNIRTVKHIKNYLNLEIVSYLTNCCIKRAEDSGCPSTVALHTRHRCLNGQLSFSEVRIQDADIRKTDIIIKRLL